MKVWIKVYVFALGNPVFPAPIIKTIVRFLNCLSTLDKNLLITYVGLYSWTLFCSSDLFVNLNTNMTLFDHWSFISLEVKYCKSSNFLVPLKIALTVLDPSLPYRLQFVKSKKKKKSLLKFCWGWCIIQFGKKL